MGVTYEVRANKAFYNQKTIKEWVSTVIDDLVAALEPVQIYAFGSVVRGDDGPDSDLDILIVFDEATNNQPNPYRFITAPIPCDVLVTNLAKFEFNKSRPWHIEHQIFKEGMLVYSREPRIRKEFYMNPPPFDEMIDAEEFLKRAESNLEGMNFYRTRGNRVASYSACFNAQQAVERSLKALLIAENSEFPKTHNLVELMRTLPDHYANLFDEQVLNDLTFWAVEGRYAADIPDLTDEDMNRLCNSAESVYARAVNLVRDIRVEREQK